MVKHFLLYQKTIPLYGLCLLLNISSSFAQSYTIQKLSAKEGLSQGMIMALCQDSDGFVWAGTMSGLNRYDGYHFKTFLHDDNDPYSPAGNRVTGIIEDSKGRIWVGYQEGLDCYDRKTGRFYHLGSKYNLFGYKKTDIAPLFETADGHIWLANLFLVVEMIVPDDFPANPNQRDAIHYNSFNEGHGFPLIDAYPFIVPLPDGEVGVSWLNGLQMRYDTATQTWEKRASTSSFEDWNQHADEMLYDPKRKGHWLSKRRSLRFIKDGKVQQAFTLPESFDITNEPAIEKQLFLISSFDQEGTLWRLHNGSLYRIVFPDGNGKNLKVETILDNKIEKCNFTKLLYASDGSFFVGTSGYGMVHVNPKTNYFNHLLKGKSIREFSVLNKDTLVMCSKSNVETILPSWKSGSYYVKKVSLIKSIYTLKAADGRIYSRYFEKNYTGKIYVNILHPDGFQEDISVPIEFIDRGDPLFEDNHERLWVSGSAGQLACLPKGGKSMTAYDLKYLWKDKVSSCIPGQIYQSQNGVIWMPTMQGLVEIHAPKGGKPEFKLWENNPTDRFSLSSNALLSVLDDPADPEHYLWVTTNGNGINKMNKQTGHCLHYTQKDGLPNDVVYGILNDSKGKLWMSTNYGLSCFNPTIGHFRNFTVDDGLQDNEFNTYSFYKFSDGKIGFGGVNGLTLFHPDNISSDKSYPSLYFTELRINNKIINLRDSSGILNEPIEFAQKIHLDYNQNFISISYAALNFAKKENNVYYYKMDGVDPNWVYADKRTEVSYPNLSPGTYTLYITNINENGEKNPNAKSIIFVIYPPWWRSSIAYLIYALLIAFGVWRAFKFQVNRLKLQNELVFKEKEAQNLQALDELKTNFFTNITHEFRTPLTLIIEPARQIHETAVSNAVKRQSSIILNNANRLLLLVNQLLDISKMEDNKIQVHWSEGDLLPIIQDLIEWFEPALQKKSQTLSLKTDLQELQGIIDRSILEKIIYNLFSNAHKFTPENGSIDLTIAQPNADTWQIVVEDTGIGIAADKLPHIFDRFYQADNTLTRHNEGTGIGLALVKELCKLLEGTIEVESTVGIGTKFTISLPISPNHANTDGTSRYSREGELVAAPQNISGLQQNQSIESPAIVETYRSDTDNHQKVLIVEDNAEMREYLNLILIQNGYAVLESENGRLGVEQALETVPDLIITDVMMPEMDGYELTETLKSNPISSHIPIMMLTAKGRQESKIEGYRRGADAYLPKPFNTEELLVRLRQLLEVRLKIQKKYQTAHFPPNEVTTKKVGTAASSQYYVAISDIDTQWLQDLERIIREKMGSDHFVYDDLPTLMLMNRTQFYAKVKALTGLTPAMLIRNIRLDKAYQLLTNQPPKTVREVMFQIGLNDTKTFVALFKERFGVLPKQATRKQVV